MCVEWITFTPPQDSFERPMLEKTKSCAMVLQEKVGEGFLRALFKKSQRKNLTKIK
jgi:hypothetical protein